MGLALGTLTEIRELKTEITGLRTDLKRFIERANQEHVETLLADLKKNYGAVIAEDQVWHAQIGLGKTMIQDCKMRDTCYALFMDFLKNTAGHIEDGEISDEIIQSYRDQMKAMRSRGPFKRCYTCFSEVNRLFEKQIDLMQSIGIYKKVRENVGEPETIPDESVVKEILEPVANTQRYQILASVMTQTRTFSDLSRITGLRGGNLLFHIKKLADSGFILQRHERGDYVITNKGYKTMMAISGLNQILNPS
jgi:DNA-binding transcriptional ArsR family regulator